MSSLLLRSSDYVIPKALTCDLASGHYDMFYGEDQWNLRAIYHITLAVFEFIPVLGQIVSIFEMFIAWAILSYFPEKDSPPHHYAIRSFERGDPPVYASSASD